LGEFFFNFLILKDVIKGVYGGGVHERKCPFPNVIKGRVEIAPPALKSNLPLFGGIWGYGCRIQTLISFQCSDLNLHSENCSLD